MTTAPLAPLLERLPAELGISRAELATALDASERSVIRWSKGEHVPQYESRARLDELTALADRLQVSFPDTVAVAAWLRAPNGSFGGKPPIDALLRGHFNTIETALDARDAGISA